MKLFFGGIIQGSNQGNGIHSQDYRNQIKSILQNRYPDLNIFDPFENHNNSVSYDDDKARDTFFMHLDELKSSDILLAYLPKASMGTAIEMWHAYGQNIPIVTISPMTTNWVIRLLADKNFETVDGFVKFLHDDDLIDLLLNGKKEAAKIEEKT
jgi:nucleoside 2-deoxyribosyltransferase